MSALMSEAGTRRVDEKTEVCDALAGVRVVELCESTEQYAGKMLAQLGAEVTLVEPLLGCDSRFEGPYLDSRPHRERSLTFAYLNQGKRSICVDADDAAGQGVIRRLAADADILISSVGPGVMAARGLSNKDLSQINPRLITANISLFGESGPYSDYVGDDLIAMAFGGMLYLGGYPGKAPTAAWGNQALLAAAQFTAVSILVALWDVESTPKNDISGQHLDISVQESVAMALENSAQFFDLEQKIKMRSGGEQRQAGMGVFSCQDGMIYLMAGGIASNRFWNGTVQWLLDEGVEAARVLFDEKWNDQNFLQTEEAKQTFANLFLPFARERTKAYLYGEGQRRRLPICPISTPADLVENRQLSHRGFFQDVLHPFTGRQILMPGAPYRLSQSPWRGGAPAPMLGEHTYEVLVRAGYEPEQLEVLMRQGVIA